MGCGSSKEYEATELGSIGTPFTSAQCTDGAPPASSAITVVCTKGISGMTISEAGSTIAKGKMVSAFNKEGAMEDASGKRFAVSKTSTKRLIPLHTKTRVLISTGSGKAEYASDDKEKPLYNFAMVSAKHAVATATGEYSLYTESGELVPMLTVKRLAGMKWKAVVYDMNGACVAKAHMSDTFGKRTTLEIAGGVDKFAVIALVTAVAPASGGGANAGSGTGAFGS